MDAAHGVDIVRQSAEVEQSRIVSSFARPLSRPGAGRRS
jgi:hypothetical protein